MTVYKPARSPNWHYDFRFKGKRFCGSTGCPGKREAESYERRMRHAAANPANERQTITLDEACGLYAEHAGELPSWPTIEYMTAALVKGIGAKRLLSEISQRELERYFAKRRAGRSNASVNREMENARAIWHRAKKARYETGEMPDWKALRLSVPTAPPRELSAEEQDRLFDRIAPDAYDAVMFALVSGWRRAEVVGLRWSDLNLQQGEARTKIKGGNTVVRPLNAALVALIANQPKVGPFVFTYVCRKSRGKRREGMRYPLTATALRARFNEAREGIEGFRFHDLRHTAATRILRATGNLAATAKALRHTNLKTTMRYAHVLDDDVRAALDAGNSRTIPAPAKRGRAKG